MHNSASDACQASAAAPPSGRRVGHLLMADMDKLADDERRFVARLLADAPKLAGAVAVAKRLHRVLRKESDKALDKVLAANLSRDKAAVQAALDLPWTTSPVEG